MKKSLPVLIAIMIVSVVAGGLLARHLDAELCKLDEHKVRRSNKPLGGFHKFASDVEWMVFINYLGSQKSINKDNVDEVSRRLEKILSYDPNFEKAIEIGTRSISIKNPEKAVELLDNACKSKRMKKNWQFPFYAGFILVHHSINKDSTIKQKLQANKRAAEFFKKAMVRSSYEQQHVVNNYVRAKANVLKLENDILKDDDVKKIKYSFYHARLHTLYEIWKKSSIYSMGNSDMPPMGMEGQMSEGIEGMDNEASIPNLISKIHEAAQDIRELDGDNIEARKLVEKIMDDVLKDKHMCRACLDPYQPGDKYCSSCSKKVKLYGTCKRCNSIVRGNFCSECGTKK